MERIRYRRSKSPVLHKGVEVLAKCMPSGMAMINMARIHQEAEEYGCSFEDLLLLVMLHEEFHYLQHGSCNDAGEEEVMADDWAWLQFYVRHGRYAEVPHWNRT